MMDDRMGFFSNRWIDLLIRYFIGITFIYASIHKIAVPAEFAKIIYGYGLVPHVFINLLAIVLPFLEFVTGVALISGVYPRAAAFLISGMLFVFIIAISINLIRGHEFDCGCFSFNKETSKYSSQLLLVRDALYLLCCIYLIRFEADRIWCISKAK